MDQLCYPQPLPTHEKNMKNRAHDHCWNSLLPLPSLLQQVDVVVHDSQLSDDRCMPIMHENTGIRKPLPPLFLMEPLAATVPDQVKNWDASNPQKLLMTSPLPSPLPSPPISQLKTIRELENTNRDHDHDLLRVPTQHPPSHVVHTTCNHDATTHASTMQSCMLHHQACDFWLHFHLPMNFSLPLMFCSPFNFHAISHHMLI